MTLVPASGPIPAKIMIVGEAPGADEVARGEPFVGVSGNELNKMLGEAGISRQECFVTNVARERPPSYQDKTGKWMHNDIEQWISELKNHPRLPDKKTPDPSFVFKQHDLWLKKPILDGLVMLSQEIAAVKPNVIIACGNLAMWALTAKWGITKWRGSMLSTPHGTKVIPTYHPSAILRQWPWRAITVKDLRTAARFHNGEPYPKPTYNFLIRPSFQDVMEILYMLESILDKQPIRLSFDLETRSGHTACAGISWTLTDALCIPLMAAGRPLGYWPEDQEARVTYALYRVLTHRNVQVVGQNILYDSQYTYRHWHFVPRVAQDCMISQHTMFAELPKSLAFQASMYCNHYVFWKDEGKNWAANQDEGELWNYNCLDCVYTDEAGQVELQTVKAMKLDKVHEFQQALFWPVLRAMQLGVRVDQKQRMTLVLDVQDQIAEREAMLISILGHPLNPRSPVQMKKLFYDDLKQPIIHHRQRGNATLDDDALQKIATRELLLKPLVNIISDIRTLGVFESMLSAPLDTDGRMRTAYNIGGSESGKSAPITFRLSSSENAFGSGMNMQNIPSDKSKTMGKAKGRGASIGELLKLPNLRSMFIPDPGQEMFDLDLDRADLQVVCWECDDTLLKAAIRQGVDIHLLNVYTLDGQDPPPLEELVETHPKYPDHRGPRKLKREFSKVFCHATNYSGGARTVASHTGRTVHEIDRAQSIWFGAHPGIKLWHTRVKDQITRFRFIENRFGYRWHIFDRVDGVLPEAIAWIPQSTVSVVINKIWMNIYQNLPEVQVLMQVHDSLVGQFPAWNRAKCLADIKSQSSITVPYPDPLVIPTGIKTSDKSWGDCH